MKSDNMKIYRQSDFKTSNWSGGKTTELFIYPKDSDYTKRNFSFRLSTATVEIEESDFTPLPGISRTLMVLDGKMKLTHQNEHECELNKGDVDQFDGAWNTSSTGTCVDFNLMTKDGTKGKLEAIFLEQDQLREVEVARATTLISLYLYEGALEIELRFAQSELNTGELMVVETIEDRKIKLRARDKSFAVLVSVQKD